MSVELRVTITTKCTNLNYVHTTGMTVGDAPHPLAIQFDFNCTSPSYAKPESVCWETSPRPSVQALPTDRPSSGRVMIPLCGPAADQQAAFAKKVTPPPPPGCPICSLG
jgi:hypothetical protein